MSQYFQSALKRSSYHSLYSTDATSPIIVRLDLYRFLFSCICLNLCLIAPTDSCMRYTAVWYVWTSERHTETFSNSRHFVKFAAVVLQTKSSEPRLPSWFECIPGHLPSARFPPHGRFACVWLLTCERFLRNVGFCSFSSPSVAFAGGIFPDSFSYCFWTPFKRERFLCHGATIVMKSICATVPIFTALCNVKELFFPLRRLMGEKNWTICKNISTCLKNLSQTTCPLGSSYGPLVWRRWGPTPLFHDLCTESTQAGTPSEAGLV